MNIEDIVSGVVVGDHSGLVVSGRGGLETPDIVGLLRRRCEEAALPFRLVRGARLRASERYGAVEDLIGIDLLDARSGKKIGTLPGHPGGVSSLTFTADGQLLSGGFRGSARLWTVPEKKPRKK